MRIVAINAAVSAEQISRIYSTRQDSPQTPAVTAGKICISAYGAVLSGSSGSADAAARRVMSHYDLRNISYTDLVRMADELKGVGALREEDYLDFIGPSPEHASISGKIVDGWNEPKDYVAMHEQQLAFLLSTGAEDRFIEFARYQLSLFQQFEAMQSAQGGG